MIMIKCNIIRFSYFIIKNINTIDFFLSACIPAQLYFHIFTQSCNHYKIDQHNNMFIILKKIELNI